MRCRLALIAALCCLSSVPAMAAEGKVLGVFDGWAAFDSRNNDRCYAIAQPARSSAGGQAGRAFAAISTWPARRVGAQVHFRLSRLEAQNSPVWLSIGERRFALTASKGDAWAQNDAMDQAIVAAMRSVTTMSVEAKGANGRTFYDLYVLKGAATAMDAARLGCLRQ